MSPAFWYGLGGAIMLTCGVFLASIHEFLLGTAGLLIGAILVRKAIDIVKNS